MDMSDFLPPEEVTIDDPLLLVNPVGVQGSIDAVIFFLSYSVEYAHEFHESLCVTLLPRDGLHLRLNISKESLKI